MDLDPQVRREMLELIGRLREGQASAAELERLAAWIRASDAHAWLYVQAMDLDAALRWDHFDGVSPPSVLQETAAWNALPAPAAHSPPRPLPAAPLTWWGTVLDGVQRTRGFSLFIAAVVVISTMLTLAQFDITPQSSPAPSSGSPVKSLQGPLAATLTGSADCRWQGRERVAGAKLYAGERLELEAGLAEVTFQDGAVTLLEGPTVFIIENGKCGRLQRGKLVAKAQKLAAGFTIETPAATVVDLGTEFAIAVDEHQATEAYVMEGQIALIYGERSSPHPPIIREVLSRGQALRVRQGEPTSARLPGLPPSSFAAHRFIRQLPPHARTWVEDFKSPLHESYVLSQSFGSGGSFQLIDGVLQLLPGASNTVALVLTAPQYQLAPGMSVEVDWDAPPNNSSQFLMLSTHPHQPDGQESLGFRLRRESVGLSVSPYLPGLADPRDPPKLHRAANPPGSLTLGIERRTATTFVFYYRTLTQRVTLATLTEPDFEDHPKLYVGVQAWCSQAAVPHTVRRLRMQPLENAVPVETKTGLQPPSAPHPLPFISTPQAARATQSTPSRLN